MEHDSYGEGAAKSLTTMLEHSVVGSEDKIAETFIQFFQDDEAGEIPVPNGKGTRGTVCCAVCGTSVDVKKAQRIDLIGRRAKRIGHSDYICGQCSERVSDVVTPRILSRMTADQIRRHLGEADRLEELYRTQFKATRTFNSGKKLNKPTLEVDEIHGWWAVPNAKNPMVFSLDKIVDAKMRVRSTRLFSELESSISINRVVDSIRKVIRSILVFFMAKKYQSGYPELPSIPSEEQPYEMTLRLKLDDDCLLCVCMGTESWSALKLFYRDGSEKVIFVDKFAHYLFAAVNCILYLRNVLGSYPNLMDDAGQANAALAFNAASEHESAPTSTPGAPARAAKGYPFGAHGGTPGHFNRLGRS